MTASETPDFTMSKVVFYNEDGTVELAKTTVRSFDRRMQTIVVPRKSFRSEEGDFVSVLFFHTAGLFEYRGTLHKNNSSPENLEIGIYKGKVKENRVAIRYAVNALAVVERYVFLNKLVSLRAPLHVKVLNVSSNGCLIQANPNFLNIGTTFQLQMEFSDSTVSFYAKVVRSKNLDKENSEFGCTFAAPELANG